MSDLTYLLEFSIDLGSYITVMIRVYILRLSMYLFIYNDENENVNEDEIIFSLKVATKQKILDLELSQSK